jgi:hypothetical protein
MNALANGKTTRIGDAKESRDATIPSSGAFLSLRDGFSPADFQRGGFVEALGGVPCELWIDVAAQSVALCPTRAGAPVPSPRIESIELARTPDPTTLVVHMSTLQSQLHELAHSFAAEVLGAIRSASLEELGSSHGSGFVGQRSRGSRATATAAAPKATKAALSNGRLPRRSAQDIQASLGQILTLLKGHKTGLRAEQIRSSLGMRPKEMPRILKEGLATKKLTSKGQKRATTYFVK